MNVDKLEDDATLFDGSLKENFGQTPNNEKSELEGNPERITDELPEDLVTHPQQSNDVLEKARASPRDRSRIF